jgi:haloalkane dehalogenase
MWRGVIELLDATHRCIAPDLPGFGRSTLRPEVHELGLDAQADRLDAFLAHVVGPDEPVTLVTHDVGALMGLAWAVRHPARVRGVVVSNVSFHEGFPWHDFARLVSAPFRGPAFLRFVPARAFLSTFRRDFPRVEEAQAREIHEAMTGRASRHTLPRLFRAMMRPGYFEASEGAFEELTRSPAVRVVWGEEDGMIPAGYADAISGGRARVLDDCGHWVPYVRPDAIADAVLAYAS